MTFRVEVVCRSDDGEQRCRVVEIERTELALETLGMSVAEGKAILHGVQDFMAGQQVIQDLKRKRACPTCGLRYPSKDAGTHTIKTVFGTVEAPNPRWERCRCQSEGSRTFRPAAAWLEGVRTAPELLYLETKWASLIPFEKAADLMKDVLPVGETTNHETIREHLQAMARVPERWVWALDLQQQFPAIGREWFLRDPRSPEPIAAAFCPECFAEQIAGRRILHLKAAWTLALVTRCFRHQLPLCRYCPWCGQDQPAHFQGTAAVQCLYCEHPLTVRRRARTRDCAKPWITAFEGAMVETLAGGTPDPVWAGGELSARCFRAC
jgi:hypothetical protein